MSNFKCQQINTYSAELMFSIFLKKPNYSYFRIVLTTACGNLADSADQDQTARSVQSYFDLHCPQKQRNLVPAL